MEEIEVEEYESSEEISPEGDIIDCPRCGEVIPQDSRFCSRCGESLLDEPDDDIED